MKATGQTCRTNSVRISQNPWPSFWGRTIVCQKSPPLWLSSWGDPQNHELPVGTGCLDNEWGLCYRDFPMRKLMSTFAMKLIPVFAIAMSGCSFLGISETLNSEVMGDSGTIYVIPSERRVFEIHARESGKTLPKDSDDDILPEEIFEILKKEADKPPEKGLEILERENDQHAKNDLTKSAGYVVCSEPFPDIAMSTAFKFIMQETSGNKASHEVSTKALELAGRTQIVLLAREFIASNCRARANGWITNKTFQSNQRRILVQIKEMIAVDKSEAEAPTKKAEADAKIAEAEAKKAADEKAEAEAKAQIAEAEAKKAADEKAEADAKIAAAKKAADEKAEAEAKAQIAEAEAKKAADEKAEAEAKARIAEAEAAAKKAEADAKIAAAKKAADEKAEAEAKAQIAEAEAKKAEAEADAKIAADEKAEAEAKARIAEAEAAAKKAEADAKIAAAKNSRRREGRSRGQSPNSRSRSQESRS